MYADIVNGTIGGSVQNYAEEIYGWSPWLSSPPGSIAYKKHLSLPPIHAHKSFTKTKWYLELHNLTTIGGPWYFWYGSCPSKAHKPVTLSGNPNDISGKVLKPKKSASNLRKKK